MVVEVEARMPFFQLCIFYSYPCPLTKHHCWVWCYVPLHPIQIDLVIVLSELAKVLDSQFIVDLLHALFSIHLWNSLLFSILNIVGKQSHSSKCASTLQSSVAAGCGITLLFSMHIISTALFHETVEPFTSHLSWQISWHIIQHPPMINRVFPF